jgi:hypothetical protein
VTLKCCVTLRNFSRNDDPEQYNEENETNNDEVNSLDMNDEPLNKEGDSCAFSNCLIASDSKLHES